MGELFLIEKKSVNKKKTMLMAALIVVILVISSIGVIVFLPEQTEETEEKEEEDIKKIDDRISPLTNQAVFFQVYRIRAKGVIDQIFNAGNPFDYSPRETKSGLGADFIHRLEGLRPGIGWDEEPIFNYIAVLDDYAHSGDVDFRTWDTGYINHCFFRNVEEEKSTTEVEFKMLKVDYKKLSNARSTKEVESFKVIYDFQTGRWTGDDSFNDSDGYGHYNGSKYEVWFKIGQTDFDDDGIPYWTEVNILDTDPTVDDSNLDPDEDGCPTAWEWKWGYDPFKWDNHSTLDPDLDGLQNTEEYFMHKWLANPYHRELYVEVDWSEKSPFKPFMIEMQEDKFLPKIVKTKYWGMDHTFWEESQQMIMDRFSEHNITVIIDDGDIETGGNHPGGDILPIVGGSGKPWYDQSTGYFSMFYNTKFDDNRKGVFRYLIITSTGGYSYTMDFGGCYDTIVITKDPIFFKNVNGGALTPRTQRIGQAVAVLHELGHSCGISYGHCGGVDNFLNDGTWDNYKSCMNYVKYGQRLFDYSDGSRGENDADDWGSLYLGSFQTTTPGDELEGVGFNPSIYGRDDPRYEKRDEERGT